MSSTTITGAPVLQDYGGTYGTGTATHSLTLYRASSGALVFGAGTVQWSWGLDASHDRGNNAPSADMQQATVNLLADMGAQPATLQPPLVAATASTDTAAPTSAITSPTAGSTLDAGTTATVSGTAADAGGGTIGGVEVSVDGGATWHPTSGRSSWTYSWLPIVPGAVTIRTRATDDSGNIESPGPGVTVNVVGKTCPCTLFTPSSAPVVKAESDPAAVEVGVKFRSDVGGFVTGVRFYKGAGNTGTHVGHLFDGSGNAVGIGDVHR